VSAGRNAASGGSALKEAKMAFFTSHTGFRRLLVLGSALAIAIALTADASGASRNIRSGTAPDVFERYAASHPYGSISVPDVLERYAAAHPFGIATLAPAAGVDRIVDDSFRDPTPIATPAAERIVDDSFRDPTPIMTPPGERIVDDSFRDTAPAVVATTSGNGLDWRDIGIGAGAMLGLTLLLTGLGLGALALRHRTGKLETS
jgi:hypothetical protein